MKDNSKRKDAYEDMIHLEHPVSLTHKPMPIYNRAAQFSPFAAVSGYDGAIKETARLTEQRIELDESEKRILDEKINIVQENLEKRKLVEFVFFSPDTKKDGGSYETLKGVVKKIDGYVHVILMEDGKKIPIDAIVDIRSELFHRLEEFFA